MEKIAVIGLGYVGLPVAVALSRKFPKVLGFDIAPHRIAALRDGVDRTGEISTEELMASGLTVSDDPDDLRGITTFIVTVPTPIDNEKRPDLEPIRSSCRLIGQYIEPGALVVFESTVYPGVTEDVCGPLLEEVSGLKCGKEFFLGYSPERINPGDRVHRLETIVKVVSAQDEPSLARVKGVYGAIIEAGLHVAPTIRSAEAAKVIENTQRDLNIALMNELSLIFERMGIRTSDVLAAACTKWNFLPFSPGLVGGHCIGVDPYYLTAAAERLGYRPEVILAGRRINDGMAAHVAQSLIKLMIKSGRSVNGARVGVLGLTFKENVPDLRNSKVPDVISGLSDYGVEMLIYDPHADAAEALEEYDLAIADDLSDFVNLDALIVAVPHAALKLSSSSVTDMLKDDGIVVDVKGALNSGDFDSNITYWSL